MFESIPPPSVSARLRNAAVPPVAAFVLTHVYFSASIALGFRFRFPVAATILGAGAIAGAVQIVRVLQGERVRGIAIGWLILAVAAVCLCAQAFLGIVFPSL